MSNSGEGVLMQDVSYIVNPDWRADAQLPVYHGVGSGAAVCTTIWHCHVADASSAHVKGPLTVRAV